MNYTKLAKEAYKMYAALRDEKFDAQQAYGIVKVCVRDYPIFREMIAKEEDEKIIGYLYFIDGHKEPIYKYLSISCETDEVHTKDGAYRRHTYNAYDGLSFRGREVTEYFTFIDRDWRQIYIIDHIELF